MQNIDWNAKAVIYRRDDLGSEMHYHFDQIAEGSLNEMARLVASMSGEQRARLIMDVSGHGNLDIHEILALAARPDLPA